MLSPITEMKAEITTAKVIQRDLQQTLEEKKKSIRKFYSTKEKVETPTIKQESLNQNKSPKNYLEPQKRQIIADKDKEQQLLKMAKEHYESYEDVAKFAKALNLRPGVVYLTLKYHNFIKQNETTQYRVLDSYYSNNGNMKGITIDTGLSVWVVANTLKQLGLSPNWATYKDRAESGKQGDWAEEEFRRLVPSAVDMNKYYQNNNAVFDFIVNEKTIDVKSTTLVRDEQYFLKIRRTADDEDLPDFFCVFCVKDRHKPLSEQGNYHVLLIPKEVLPSNRVKISFVPKHRKANSTMYWDFEVEPATLSAFLENI